MTEYEILNIYSKHSCMTMDRLGSKGLITTKDVARSVQEAVVLTVREIESKNNLDKLKLKGHTHAPGTKISEPETPETI